MEMHRGALGNTKDIHSMCHQALQGWHQQVRSHERLHPLVIVFLLILLCLSSKNGIMAESIGNDILNAWFIMELGCKLLNDHLPIEDPLTLDVAINQVFMVSKDSNR
jgi:hypothetical protein